MTIRWSELDDFPDYAVNELGEIHNIKTGMPRKTSANQQGIVKISLYQGRELITRSVAVLVAEATTCQGPSGSCGTGGMFNEAGWPDNMRLMSGSGPSFPIFQGVWQS